MVAEHYAGLGFVPSAAGAAHLDPTVEGATAWELELSNYTQANTHIKVLEFTHA
jgi:hypothetical protein